MNLFVALALLAGEFIILMKLFHISDQIKDTSDSETINTISSKVQSITDQVKRIIK